MLESNFRKQFDSNEIIFQQGDPGYYACIIERGSVAVSIEKDGQQVILSNLGEGAVFGEMALIDEQPRTATITTTSPTELVVISREQFDHKMQDSHPLIRMILRVLLARFRNSGAHFFQHGHEAIVELNEDDTVPDLQHLHQHALAQLQLESRLIKAIEQDEFIVYYQPIYHLPSNTIAGYEALVRWQHPEKGILPPFEFIELAETTGLINPIGVQVLGKACADLMQMQQAMDAPADRPPLFMSINLSASQLRDHEIVDHLQAVIDSTGVNPAHIKLEVTESLLMQDPELAADILTRIKQIGFRLAIDDFGTGYSSLSYLHRFPFDTLKIDRSFVSQITHDQQSHVITEGIANMAHSLGLDIVAEGVEEAPQLEVLHHYRCDFVQGYYMSRPVAYDEAIKHLGRKLARSA